MKKFTIFNKERDKKEFLAKFDWNISILAADQKNDFESIVVEFEDIFARHRLD